MILLGTGHLELRRRRTETVYSSLTHELNRTETNFRQITVFTTKEEYTVALHKLNRIETRF